MFQQRPANVPGTSRERPHDVPGTSRERVNDVLLTSKEPYTKTSRGRSQRPFRGRSGDLLLLAGGAQNHNFGRYCFFYNYKKKCFTYKNTLSDNIAVKLIKTTTL